MGVNEWLWTDRSLLVCWIEGVFEWLNEHEQKEGHREGGRMTQHILLICLSVSTNVI